MTEARVWDIHCNIKWLYLSNLGCCYILRVFL